VTIHVHVKTELCSHSFNNATKQDLKVCVCYRPSQSTEHWETSNIFSGFSIN